jgi:geranylgeranyl diphosphate synthase type II
MDLKGYLSDKRALIEDFLKGYFEPPIRPQVLNGAMVYSLLAGGKRIRPILCLASYEACGGDAKDIVAYASALEFIHTYSLIHDDLPAMDNDDLRRGKPTNHKVFGEGMAILAGDGLLTEAFHILSRMDHPTNNGFRPSAASLLRVIQDVARSAGLYGMVAGQAQDLLSEDSEPDEETLTFIHTHKTAALITASVRMGAILANAPEELLLTLTCYGTHIGLAFQVVDDILDITQETETLGKPKGSDERKKKSTYPKFFGLDGSRQRAQTLATKAIECLQPFGDKAEALREIARYLVIRTQ